MNLRYIVYVILIFFLTSCSKDDQLQPSNTEKNYFAPSATATDEESVLKRDFYAAEKSYVIFNDTVKHDAAGKDANGVMRYDNEVIDISYDLIDTDAGFRYTYEYLPTIVSKKNAVTIVRSYLMTHLSGGLKPYAILLVNKIKKYSKVNNTYTYVKEERFAAGKWGIVLSVDGLAAMTDVQLTTAMRTTLVAILSSKLAALDQSLLNDFYTPVGNVFTTAMPVPAYTTDLNLQYLKRDGFLTPYNLLGIVVINGFYPYKTDDMTSFLTLLLNTPEAQVLTDYAAYPKVITRYKALKKIVAQIGYVF